MGIDILKITETINFRDFLYLYLFFCYCTLVLLSEILILASIKDGYLMMF
jgi:hypothetical protein